MTDPVYFRQLKAGRDFGRGDPVAAQMENFIYLVGDREAGECLVVDPAWDVQGVLDRASEDGMRVVGALVTHWHPDHVGGPLFGHDVQGVQALLDRLDVPVYVHRRDLPWVARVTGVPPSALRAVDGGDVVRAGQVEVQCLHTPGHTEGSQCFRCAHRLIAGDTLFLQGCGRVDLPGADVDEMWRTLKHRLATIADEVELYPGHDYASKPHAPLGEVRRTNPVLHAPTLDLFRRMMGR